MARKLCVAVWHVLMGHAIGTLERVDTLRTKLGKFATGLGPAALHALGFEDNAWWKSIPSLIAPRGCPFLFH